jgi:tellurite resistance protein
MADEELDSQTRLNMSYSMAAMDDKLQEVTEEISEKFQRMESIQSNMDSKIDAMCELILNRQNP